MSKKKTLFNKTDWSEVIHYCYNINFDKGAERQSLIFMCLFKNVTVSTETAHLH